MKRRTWNTLEANEVNDIVVAYRAGGIEAIREMADALEITPETLARYCRFFNQYQQMYHKITSGIVIPSNDNKILLPNPEPASKLTDIEEVDLETDQMAWLTWLLEKKANNSMLTVMHPSDIHEPFSDPGAIDLFYKVAEVARPSVVVGGSDFADMYLTTAFEINPDLAKNYSDELDLFEQRWHSFVHRLDDVLGYKPPIVWIYGNHERRLINFLLNQAPNLRKRVMRDFQNVIQMGGRVWYIGEVDHVRIGPLHVEHGNRHNEHVTKSRLIDEGGQVSMMFGHVHKRNFYEIAGADFVVNSISSGGLCPTKPHYQKPGTSSRSGRKHTQGTGIATLTLNQRNVQFENIRFVTEYPEKYCYFRGERLSTDLSLVYKVMDK